MRRFVDWCVRSFVPSQPAEAIGHGEMRLLVLHTVLGQGPLSAREIEQRLEAQLAAAGIDGASIEPVIETLDRMDYLRQFPHAQVLGITEDGIALLDSSKAMLFALLDRLDVNPVALEDQANSVFAALDGLATTLRLSVLGGRLDMRQAREVRRTIETLTDRLEHA